MNVFIWSTSKPTGQHLADALIDAGCAASVEDAGIDSLIRDPSAVGIYMTRWPINAITFLRDARSAGASNCILVLLDTTGTPSTLARQRISMLAAGADDAQHWPLDLREVCARVKAIAGRDRAYTDAPVALPGGFYYRITGHIVGGKTVINFTKAEQNLFEAMVDRPGSIVTKAQLMSILYHGRDEAQDKIVDVFICKIRKKLAPVTNGLDLIETVWGQGYRFIQHGFRPARIETLKRVSARA